MSNKNTIINQVLCKDKQFLFYYMPPSCYSCKISSNKSSLVLIEERRKLLCLCVYDKRNISVVIWDTHIFRTFNQFMMMSIKHSRMMTSTLVKLKSDKRIENSNFHNNSFLMYIWILYNTCTSLLLQLIHMFI